MKDGRTLANQLRDAIAGGTKSLQSAVNEHAKAVKAKDLMVERTCVLQYLCNYQFP